MPRTGIIRVDLESLASSASHVTGPLNAKTATWLETSRSLVTSVADHATDLNQDGVDFAAMERDAVEKLQALQPTANSSAGLA